jgi:YesN/AraC family two-component response regulator
MTRTHPARLSERVVLVVDDEELVRQYLTRTLSTQVAAC